ITLLNRMAYLGIWPTDTPNSPRAPFPEPKLADVIAALGTPSYVTIDLDSGTPGLVYEAQQMIIWYDGAYFPPEPDTQILAINVIASGDFAEVRGGVYKTRWSGFTRLARSQ